MLPSAPKDYEEIQNSFLVCALAQYQEVVHGLAWLISVSVPTKPINHKIMMIYTDECDGDCAYPIFCNFLMSCLHNRNKLS